MKKLILVVVLLFALAGCTTADYLDNREQFMLDCQADPVCVDAIVSDADVVIAQTQTIADLNTKLQNGADRIQVLEDDNGFLLTQVSQLNENLSITNTVLINTQADLDAAESRILALEYDVNALELIVANHEDRITQNEADIADLKNLEEKLLDISRWETAIGQFAKSLGLEQTITLNKVGENSYVLEIRLDKWVDAGYTIDELRPMFKNYIKTDLVDIKNTDNLTLNFWLNGEIIYSKTLTEIINSN